MTTPFGASPSDWSHWDLVLGLTDDLLPVVCEPGLPISPTSQLVGYGKVPSRFDREGRVVGFPGWTRHVTTPEEIERWRADSRIGICLQTRHVRAIDVDVEDLDAAMGINQTILHWAESQTNWINFPVRFRSNSSKFLLLFQLEGEFPKQVLQTSQGAIELLMNGQQCLVCGTHPSGSRYRWFGEYPSQIPSLTVAQFADLKALLALCYGGEWSEGRLRKERRLLDAYGVVPYDPVVQYLLTRHPELHQSCTDARVDIPCPWTLTHTTGTDPTATSYFPAGSGGYETGGFRCLHAHCSGRTTAEFLDAIGYTLDGFEDLTAGESQDVVSVLTEYDDLVGADPEKPVTVSPIEAPRFDRDKQGKIRPHMANVVTALTRPDFCGLRLGRDSFLDQIVIGDALKSTTFTDDDYGQLLLTLRHQGFGPADIPIETLRRAVSLAARRASFDSAINWLRALPPWDGVERVPSFCSRYLGADETPYHTAVSRYWWTAHAGRVLAAPIQADMAIILVSAQGTGKSSAIKAMVPSTSQYIPLSFNTPDEEQARLMRGTLIGELAELSGLKGRDAETTKAWISCTTDTLRQLYKEFTYQLPRRLVLVGTSNRDDFAGDETGHRRLLPVQVGEHQDREAIERDRDQLWAEGAVLFDRHGILWADAEALAPTEHQNYEPPDPSEAFVREWLQTPDPFDHERRPADRESLPIHEVMEYGMKIVPQQFTMNNMHRAGRILHTLGYVRRNVKIEGHVSKMWFKA